MTETNEFLKMATLWLRRNGHRDAQRVVAVVPDKEQRGGCHTCWHTVEVVHFAYVDINGAPQTVTQEIEYAGFIKSLEKIAYNEDRRRPRLQMFRDLKAAVAAMPGREDMVYVVLHEQGLRFPGPDGKQRKVRKDAVLTYLPPESIPWLIEQGHVKPMCAHDGGDVGCEWCRLAALTSEDRDWLSYYGWANPFSDQGD